MKDLIYTRLQGAFNPTHLEVRDESENHKGHAGYGGGGRHFAILISAECFHGVSRVEGHRKIYEALDDLLKTKIHALRIILRSSSSNGE